MEFTCDKREIQAGVAAVEKIVATRSALPVIANILVDAGREEVKLSANNLEMGMELKLKANVTKEGSLLLPAKTLGGIVSKLPEGVVSFRLNENRTVRISYDKSQFNLHSLPPDEFPVLPKVKEGKTISIDAEVFATMIKQTIFAVSTSEDKYALTGVLLETGRGAAADQSNIRMVATDGYRLAKKGAKVASLGEGGINIIIPAKALLELLKIIETRKGEKLKVNVSGEQISFAYKDAYLVSRTIQGQFPDYKQVVPKKSNTQVILRTRELLEAAERATVIASGSANVTCFEIKSGKVHLSASTPDVGSIDEVIEAEVKGTEKARVSFNIRLITDVLEVIDAEKVILELGEGLSPGVIHPEGEEEYFYLVMPIRTQEAV